MKKFTFKFTVLILLALVFQAQAQIVSGNNYTLKNVATANYLSTGGGNGWLYAPVANLDDKITTSFMFTSLNDAFTMQGSRPGLMVMRANGVVGQSTTLASAGSIAEDRQLTLEKITGTPFDNLYYIHREKYLRENTEDEVTAATYPSIVAGADFDVADQRQMWLLEPAATLSTIQIAESSVFMSNPVKDNVSISGLTAEINQIHVYSLLGAKVISQEVNNLSSLQINVSGLSKGMYVVNFVGENVNFTKKLIKE